MKAIQKEHIRNCAISARRCRSKQASMFKSDGERAQVIVKTLKR
jgi:hypothetical protein